MKITIKGSPREVAELTKALLNGKGANPLFQPRKHICKGDKGYDLVVAAQSESKENAPQEETAEQNYEIRYFNTTAKDLEKASQDISERRSMIESMRS